MATLQIYDRRERLVVAAADGLLSVVGGTRAVWRRGARCDAPSRILLLRLERIGDLLMVLPAIADLRALAPDAEIDLIVGSWNLPLGRTIPGVSQVEALDARWLARGVSGHGLLSLLRRARQWRARRYDLAVNFEPDVRSNLLLAASGATRTVGYRSGGGGPLLDVALDYRAEAHTTDNARNLIATALGAAAPATPLPALILPDAARHAAAARLPRHHPGPIIGLHVSGGRAIKQWPPERFAEVGGRLAESCGATLVLTGASEDRALVHTVRSALTHHHVVDVSGDLDLPALAALLERLDLLVTGDTGPMHLAAAVGTPVVAVFGPSDPARYAPRGRYDRVVRIDLPCSPCNRIRLPPARCVGHTPDCLAGVPATQVFDAAMSALSASGALRAVRAGRA